MVRTLVSLDDSAKRWLDKYSGAHKQSTAQTVRFAIKEFQKKTQEHGYYEALHKTAGLLKSKGDSLKFVRRLRKEWD